MCNICVILKYPLKSTDNKLLYNQVQILKKIIPELCYHQQISLPSITYQY